MQEKMTSEQLKAWVKGAHILLEFADEDEQKAKSKSKAEQDEKQNPLQKAA